MAPDVVDALTPVYLDGGVPDAATNAPPALPPGLPYELSPQYHRDQFDKKAKELATALEEDLKKQAQQQQDDTQKQKDKMEENDITVNGHIETRHHEFIIGVPEIRMRPAEFSFDMPVVKMQKQNVSLDLPVVKMKRVQGPDIPQSKLEWTNDGPFGTPSPTWRHWTVPSYYEVPEFGWETQGFSFDVPVAIGTERVNFVMDLPDVTIVDQKVSLDYPVLIVDEWSVGSQAGNKKENAEDEIKRLKDEGDERRNKRLAEFNSGLGKAFLEFIPSTLVDAANRASFGMMQQAVDLIQKNHQMQPQLLAVAGLPAGHPDRLNAEAPYRQNLVKLMFLDQANNGAMYQAWKHAREALTSNPSYGLTKEEIEESLKQKNAYDAPASSFELQGKVV